MRGSKASAMSRFSESDVVRHDLVQRIVSAYEERTREMGRRMAGCTMAGRADE